MLEQNHVQGKQWSTTESKWIIIFCFFCNHHIKLVMTQKENDIYFVLLDLNQLHIHCMHINLLYIECAAIRGTPAWHSRPTQNSLCVGVWYYEKYRILFDSSLLNPPVHFVCLIVPIEWQVLMPSSTVCIEVSQYILMHKLQKLLTPFDFPSTLSFLQLRRFHKLKTSSSETKSNLAHLAIYYLCHLSYIGV